MASLPKSLIAVIAFALPVDGQTLRVAPKTTTMDGEVSIVVDGISPGQTALIRATSRDRLGVLWTSSAAIRADANGTIRRAEQDNAELVAGTAGDDLRQPRQLSLSESLLTSMVVADDPNSTARFEATWSDTVVTVFGLEVKGSIVAYDTLQRTFLAPGVRARTIDDSQLVGTVFERAAGARLPGVLVIGGSEGGNSGADVAAQLAGHGFTTLSLAYFGESPLPLQLDRIPLEYFERAIGFLRRQASVDPARIGLLSTSKGSEAALLVAARFSGIAAIVAYAPSSVAWSCICDTTSHPSWTARGVPISSVAPGSDPAYRRSPGEPIRPAVNYLFRLSTAPSGAQIPVGSISAPMLLIAGDDDSLWPSALMARRMFSALAPSARRSGSRLLVYAGAGHFIGKSLLPAGSTRIARGRIDTGGTPSANARAGVDAWTEALAFLRQHLQR